MDKANKPRKKRPLSLASKVYIILQVRNGRSQVDVRKDYFLSSSTLSGILKDKSKLLSEFKRKCSKSLHDDQLSNFLDVALYEWYSIQYEQANNNNEYYIDLAELRDKANELAETLDMKTYLHNRKWLNNFIAQHNISLSATNGDDEYSDQSMDDEENSIDGKDEENDSSNESIASSSNSVNNILQASTSNSKHRHQRSKDFVDVKLCTPSLCDALYYITEIHNFYLFLGDNRLEDAILKIKRDLDNRFYELFKKSLNSMYPYASLEGSTISPNVSTKSTSE